MSKANKPDIEKLLTSDDTNKSVIGLDNYICELCGWGDELNLLTEPQKNFYFNQNLEREINNGGLEQFFLNSSGDFAYETVLSLKTIRANKTADILQTAINQFTNKTVPNSHEERQVVVENIDAKVKEIWNELDQKFFAYEDDLNTLNIEYIRRNKDKF